MIREKIDFYAFCGRRAAAFPDRLMGKPVLEPHYLIEHAEQFYVVIAAYNYYGKITAGLSDFTGTAYLATTGKGSSFLIENWNLPYHQENLMRIDMIRLDDCVRAPS